MGADEGVPAARRSKGGVLVTLQFIRFVAALMVLFSHVWSEMAEMAARRSAPFRLPVVNGQFGVETFFVISGFIMVHISLAKFGRPGAARRFLKERIARVVPLYWLLTGLQALYIAWLALREPTERGMVSAASVVQSLAFIPFSNVRGEIRPLLAQGWTLDYEMFFYLLFTASLLLPMRYGLAALFGLLLLLPIVVGAPGAGVAAMTYGSPLLLYFAIGMGLALVRRAMIARGPLPFVPLPMMMSALVAGLFIVLDNLAPAPAWHWLLAPATVSLAVLTRDAEGISAGGRAAVLLGNASYALYLSHGFALELLRPIWRRAFDWGDLALYGVVAPTLGLALALVCYFLIQKPLDRRFRRRQDRLPEDPDTLAHRMASAALRG